MVPSAGYLAGIRALCASTFGGNPLACAVGRLVIRLLRTGTMQQLARENGAYLYARLNALVGHGVSEVRGREMWAGVQLAP